jgi:sulfite exporter TauE/SafE
MNIFEQGLDLIFIIHIFATFAMCGVIWLVQVVHYPSFEYVEKNSYRDFQYFHMGRITLVVGPLMLIELISLALLMFKDYQNIYLLISSISLLLIWLNTGLWNVPLHNELLNNKDPKTIKKLVVSNWPRTILWCVRSVLLVLYWLDKSV